MAMLLDFVAFRPPEELVLREGDMETVLDNMVNWGSHHKVSEPGNIHIMRRFHHTTGIMTGCGPPNLMRLCRPGAVPSRSFSDAFAEARLCMCGSVRQLLHKTGLAGADIDFLVTACSSLNPVPTLSSMLVNEFKMRPEVRTLHLGGMACAAGALGIALVADLLKANPNSTALFVTHENVTEGFYTGGNATMLLANVLFRMGGAALLFTNKRHLSGARGRLSPKYQLLHSASVHMAADDRVYRSMGMFKEDEQGLCKAGFTFDTPSAASKAVTAVVKRIAPRVLTWRQLGAAALNELQRRCASSPESVPPYQPCFADCITHFMLHPGIHGMLRGFMKGLHLPPHKVLPSAAALRDYGNTSASSTFYVLAYLESLEGVRRGDTVMQLSVGTGVKAGVNVFRALRDVVEPHPAWAHLRGVPVREADLLLPLSRGAAGADEMAATAQLFRELMSREGRSEGEDLGGGGKGSSSSTPAQDEACQQQLQNGCSRRAAANGRAGRGPEEGLATPLLDAKAAC